MKIQDKKRSIEKNESSFEDEGDNDSTGSISIIDTDKLENQFTFKNKGS